MILDIPHQDLQAILGTNLRHMREDAGLTLAQMAARLGMTQARLEEAEAGADPLTGTELTAVTRQFGCSFAALFADPRPERLLQ